MGEELNLIIREDDCAAFDPTEDELMLHFLRPQLRGFSPRVAGAVVEADPCAAAPWDLLALHGRRDEGYFFSPRARASRRKQSVRRTIAGGGAWMHSSTKNGQSVSELGVVVRWCRVNFCFYVFGGSGGEAGRVSTGWMMAEYEITDPRCYRRADDGEEDEFWVLCHVRKSSRSPAVRDSTSAAAPAKSRRRKAAVA
uniref:NAC domain-containing protein n=1 Tax=Leersia perrieri TaxID=77586 RepID=A0A0D9VA60_9ORYZ